MPIPSVYGYLLTKGVGYIQLNRFAETSGKEFRKILNELKLKGAKKLVLDLRDNPWDLW